MNHYLGIDIGTFESKGVLVDANGRIVASAAKPHEMIVPQPGWAEHRPQGRLVGRPHVHHPKAAGRQQGRAGLDQGDGMQRDRPLHASRRRRGRAADERRALRRRRARQQGNRGSDGRDRRGRAARPLRQCAHLAGGRPEDSLAEAQPPGDLCEDADDPQLDLIPRRAADRRGRHRPLHGLELGAALHGRPARVERRARPGHHRARPPAEARLDHRHRRHGHQSGRRRKPGLRKARRSSSARSMRPPRR